jgi:hypothetical protein
MAYPAPRSEIKIGKTTDPYGHFNRWRSPSGTLADEQAILRICASGIVQEPGCEPLITPLRIA